MRRPSHFFTLTLLLVASLCACSTSQEEHKPGQSVAERRIASTERACTQDSDCPSFGICGAENLCLRTAQCRSDLDCGMGQSCQAGQCFSSALDDSPSPSQSYVIR